MKRAIGNAARRLAPKTIDGLHDLDMTRQRFGDLEEVVARMEQANADLWSRVVALEEEIDELRRDAPRTAELYDVVLTRLAQPN
ncbi:hypothetical protein ACFCVO_04615 [Agromyces sp. NPDC056379]|uniref:hypothetical protein n=1 Tax=unclassified Agromyces TaxID=2639701 RepID=UPI0035D8B893